MERIELKTLDYRFLWRGIEEPDDRIVILGVDDKSLDKIKDPMIFWRPHFAKVIKKLAESGAKSVGLDFVFALALKKSIDGLDYDRIMAMALKEADNVILTKTFKHDKESNSYFVTETIPRLRFAANRHYSGFANLTNDPDNCVRRQALMIQDENGKGHLAFGLAILAKYFDKLGKESINTIGQKIVVGDINIPINRYGEMITNFAGPSGTFPHISFYDAWRLADSDDSTFFRDNFAGKIVLIGTTNIMHQDFKPTPFFGAKNYREIRSTYGIEIWANVVNTILKGSYIFRLSHWQISLIIFLCGIFIAFISLQFSLLASSIVITLLGMGYTFVCVALFIKYDVWVDIVAPLIVMPLTYGVIFTYRYNIESKKKAVVKNLFQYYLHPSVVNELLANPESVKLGGVKKNLTMFFSDIAGFTTISEQMGPEELVGLINDYLTDMSNIIIKNEGTIDKYEGDAIMSFFGAPIDLENNALSACYSAIECHKHLKVISRKFKEKGWPEIDARIGINSGTVVVGNMGGENRFDYTVLGDDVNLASRLEGANKVYSTNIMIGESTYEQAKSDVVARELDIIRVKGKSRPVKVYELIDKKENLNDKTEEMLQNFHKGIEAYREMEWDRAITCFSRVIELEPEDGPAQLYIDRCYDFSKFPPPDGWDGIYDMKSK